MPRTRIYATNAEKQAAYRERRKPIPVRLSKKAQRSFVEGLAHVSGFCEGLPQVDPSGMRDKEELKEMALSAARQLRRFAGKL